MNKNEIMRLIDHNKDLTNNLLVKEPEINIEIEKILQRYPSEYISIDDYDRFKSMSNKDIGNHLVNGYRVVVTDIDKVSETELAKLCVALHEMTTRRMGNIVGFLNSEMNTSYSKTKEYTRENLSGDFQSIFLKVLIFNKLCWNISGSSQTKVSERTAFNKLIDRKSVEIASNIILHSKANQESKKYPLTGLLASIQALRFIGWNDVQIQNISRELNLADVVYVEYDTKPRKHNEARSIRSVMMSRAHKIAQANKSNHVETVIEDKLGWEN